MQFALLFLLCVQSQQPMSFKVPDGAKEEDVKATVKAISLRIAEYGYRDIIAKQSADGKQIQISSEAPFNNAVRAKIYLLSTVQANDVVFRFAYPLTNAEAEQYRPGEAAPKGAKWLKLSNGWILMKDAPTYPVDGSIKWYPKKKDGLYDMQVQADAHLSVDEGTSKALAAIPKEVIVKIRLFIDGQMVDLGGNIFPKPTSFKWVIGKLDGWDTLGVCLNHPIPLKLSH